MYLVDRQTVMAIIRYDTIWISNYGRNVEIEFVYHNVDVQAKSKFNANLDEKHTSMYLFDEMMGIGSPFRWLPENGMELRGEYGQCCCVVVGMRVRSIPRTRTFSATCMLSM